MLHATYWIFIIIQVSLFVFPEGTRNISGRLLPFKKGAFHLAIQTHLPIQPVVVSCYNSFLDHKRFSLTPGVFCFPVGLAFLTHLNSLCTADELTKMLFFRLIRELLRVDVNDPVLSVSQSYISSLGEGHPIRWRLRHYLFFSRLGHFMRVLQTTARHLVKPRWRGRPAH